MKKSVLYTVLIASCIEPEFFCTISPLHMLYTGIRLFALLYVILCHVKDVKFTLFDVSVFAYFAVGYAITLIVGADLAEQISDSIPTITMCLLVKIMLEDDVEKCFSCLNRVFSALVIANFLFYIALPNGYDSYYSTSGALVIRYFLGVDNQFASVLIPAIAISGANALYKHGKVTVSMLIVTLISLLTLILTRSGSAVIGAIIVGVYLVFMFNRPLSALATVQSSVAAYVILYVGIVFFKIQNAFAFLIENVLGKDTTLSSRTEIWQLALEKISQRPALGYGYIEGGKYIMLQDELARSAHNTLLQIVLQGGLVLLAMFVICYCVAMSPLRKNQKNPIANLIIVVLFSMMIMMLVEVYQLTTFFMLLAICCYSAKITEGYNKLHKEVSDDIKAQDENSATVTEKTCA